MCNGLKPILPTYPIQYLLAPSLPYGVLLDDTNFLASTSLILVVFFYLFENNTYQ